MNQLDIEKALQLNKEVTSGTKKSGSKASSKKGIPSTTKKNSIAVDATNIDSIEDMLFGDYDPSADNSTTREYDPNEELKMLKEKQLKPREDLKKSNIPPAILESILKNPIEVDVSVSDDIDQFISEKGLAPDNIKAITEINERLEKYESGGKALDESTTETIENINQNQLVKLIEDIFDKKIDELKKVMINESRSNTQNAKIKGFQMCENGNFRFLASNDDVYECKMRYLGKNKRRKK